MATMPGKFTPQAQIQAIQSANTGRVADIFVENGAHVRAGQPLLRLDSEVDRMASHMRKLSQSLKDLQQERLAGQLNIGLSMNTGGSSNPYLGALEQRVSTLDKKRYHHQLMRAKAKLKEAFAVRDAAQATLKTIQSRERLAGHQVSNARPLAVKGAISRYRFNQLRDHAMKLSGKLAAQHQKVRKARHAVREARSALAETRAAYRADLVHDLEKAISRSFDLARQRKAARARFKGNVIRSPVSGWVQGLQVVSPGQVVRAGQTIATVVPESTTMLVQGDLPSNDVGFVEAGQSVKIHVTAYPFAQYGSIPGEIVWISPTAESNTTVTARPPGEDHSSPRPATGTPIGGHGGRSAMLYYRVRVRPARDYLWINGHKARMQPGMVVSIDIKTGHRRIIEFFLDPIFKYFHSGLSVR